MSVGHVERYASDTGPTNRYGSIGTMRIVPTTVAARQYPTAIAVQDGVPMFRLSVKR
jgi:hypothetical protein